jgi:hypothetical protein
MRWSDWSVFVNTFNFVIVKPPCVLLLLKHMQNFGTYPVVSNSKVEFAYSTIISIIRLFDYYFHSSIIPSLKSDALVQTEAPIRS